MKTVAIWKYLQRIQQELQHGTLRTQDDAINALRDYVERAQAARLFPSFLYPQFQEIFTYYNGTMLPRLNLCSEDKQTTRAGFEHTLQQIAIQEQTARQRETQIKNGLQRCKAGDVTSLKDLTGRKGLTDITLIN